MSIDPGAPEPVYQQLAAILREEIGDGTRAPRSKLPSLMELSETYEVAVNTVQKALRVLKDEGLVTGSPGRGTYVSPSAPR